MVFTRKGGIFMGYVSFREGSVIVYVWNMQRFHQKLNGTLPTDPVQ